MTSGKIWWFVVGAMAVFASCTKEASEERGQLLSSPQNFRADPQRNGATFSWEEVAGADGYFLEVSESNSFSAVVAKTDTTVSTTAGLSGLRPATAYYARLRAINRTNPSLTSSALVIPFTTLDPEYVEEALAFPGADGFGKETTGGRGGRVIKVTNLHDAGEGSLRAAVNASGPRIVVFEVSGNIELQSPLRITNGDLTIAGQTAPGDGICVQDYEVFVNADNVIIRFMRFRLGDRISTHEPDALWGRYRKNVVIDHCSISWSIDEAASFYANQDFTMQWCIISESLNSSIHGKGDHGYGGIWGGDRASFHHNLLAHHNSRTPRFNGGGRSGIDNGPYPNELVDFSNNVVYNWGDNGSYGGENGSYNMTNNYYKSGPATPSSRRNRLLEIYYDTNTSFYINGNYMHGNAIVTADNWSGVVVRNGNQQQAQVSVAFATGMSTVETAEQAYESVLSYAGASLKRDAVDVRIVDEVKNGTTTYIGSVSGKPGLIDTQTDVGGWPILQQGTVPQDTDGDGIPDAWEVANGLNPNLNDANGRDLSAVYDNIEVYVNSLVADIIR